VTSPRDACLLRGAGRPALDEAEPWELAARGCVQSDSRMLCPEGEAMHAAGDSHIYTVVLS
jgi:hypothetical protein